MQGMIYYLYDLVTLNNLYVATPLTVKGVYYE